MSNAIFPTLPGLAFDVGKSPMFSTDIKTSVSGRELRRSNWVHPIYQISLTFEFLRDDSVFDELKTLLGFYMQRQGSFDSFLFHDPDDYWVFNQQFGTGDGVTTQFQMVREYGGFSELVSNVNAPTVSIGPLMWSPDGLLSMWRADSSSSNLVWGPDSSLVWGGDASIYGPADYTVSASGVVTFTSPPAAGEPLLWNGEYYYRCRFADDQLDFNKFMQQLWTLKTCSLIGSLGARI